MDTEKIKLRTDLGTLTSRVEGVDSLERALAGRIEGVEALGKALSVRIDALEQAAREDAARKAQRLSWLKKKQPNQPEHPAQEGAA